ncbi:hypothetical protein I2I11_09160 [Pontibacter sp. 172403-2]|uniref:hypothetical protein n=1 Tax=Pontibacter rufus TaxID=2791028 RepID=UPI0018AF8BD8|nr:hypothetical protein [Pontibacter sp. 172403-2]MBF9253458.1 hypothetical protein [Pontibacter sp. 172403-2]
MRYYLWLSGIIFVLSSCRPDQGGTHNSTLSAEGTDSGKAAQDERLIKEAKSTTDSVAFEAAFERFFAALQAQDTAALNAFIDPKQGFWLIEQPGAVPAYTHYSQVQEVKRSYQELPFVSIAAQMQACNLQQREHFPEFDCAMTDNGGSGYAEDGCFYTNGSAFRQNNMWQYAGLSKQQEKQVQDLQRQVKQSVLHTYTSYRFHFGYDGQHWRLYFADLRVPCSA